MGKITGFMEVARQDLSAEPPGERIKNFSEFTIPLALDEISSQGSRCMDCGIPFCQTGCPVNNIIPDWNDLVYKGHWRSALETLHSTNNFPEFTGRICPAPCESACVLNINNDAVTIKNIERTIIDHGWEQGWVTPEVPAQKTGKKVAVVGSGPAGLAAAQQLARVGHEVTVFEKNDRIGGLLRYGIPDFKMEKHLIDRRVKQMQVEGVSFKTNVNVGVTLSHEELLTGFDAVLLTGGSEHPRDLTVPGRELNGVHFAMSFLPQQNKRNAGDSLDHNILATGKHVVVIGGGDTGSDCVGTSIRQGALSVTQFELMPRPPEKENKPLVWPNYPMKLRTSSSQEEGCERDWSVATKAFLGNNGNVEKLLAVRLDWQKNEQGQMVMKEIPGSEFEVKADLVLLAMGYVHPIHEGLLKSLGVGLDTRGNIQASTDNYQTNLDKVFAAGDIRRGQSLVVWAIREGRQAARAVDEYLMGSSVLPR
ncbi:MAG: glutamate synthase [Ferrovum sp. 37-45-19]|uniref:glutamate synthase subunit beta n=1 Tax=Ferrovum sp. JA12 TaxID=1356299 RepID=UPI0007026EEF|nr:glutamate synthase subunit beta [Ferrovum sp. JA12]OYV79368.1 MAG: glutamate synthase [Ferrovum sp. 21-44-67]OYV93993.1 MAG: glutamate synthase [Ferrovum sp. 37-45-19]HQT81827.1 glutamate synthase subunit beta [Ferrovaceae bacterium]KRH79372.1 glutamate synthase [NADPH] small chain [Ferrovum sp. JA12]HQU06780.1 glutamate synthase subunit beta [Ferrovaceae bacterium]